MQFATIERNNRILYVTIYCSMEIGQLIDSNPWWTTKKVPDEWKGIHRNDYDALLRSLSIREITIITGVRRSGKSTLMYQMVDRLLKRDISPEQILFIDLEDHRIADVGLEDIYQTYLFSC